MLLVLVLALKLYVDVMCCTNLYSEYKLLPLFASELFVSCRKFGWFSIAHRISIRSFSSTSTLGAGIDLFYTERQRKTKKTRNECTFVMNWLACLWAAKGNRFRNWKFKAAAKIRNTRMQIICALYVSICVNRTLSSVVSWICIKYRS